MATFDICGNPCYDVINKWGRVHGAPGGNHHRMLFIDNQGIQPQRAGSVATVGTGYMAWLMPRSYGGLIMRITNVIEICDNGEFISIVTETGSAVHLPCNAEHSICIEELENPSESHVFNVCVDLYQG